MDTFVLWRCSLSSETELICILPAFSWSLRFVYIRYWVDVLLCFVLFCMYYEIYRTTSFINYLFIYKICLIRVYHIHLRSVQRHPR